MGHPFSCLMAGRLFLDNRFHHFPDAGCKDSAYERADDEYPELLESFAAFEYCRSDAACRVNRSAGVVDANQVDKDQ